VVTTFLGCDTDLEACGDPTPVDLRDDFSGSEPYTAAWECLDPCGEPAFSLHRAAIEDGALTATGGTVLLPLARSVLIPGREPTLTAEVRPGGGAATVEACAHASIHDLGLLVPSFAYEDLNMLEAMLAGGDPVGLPSVPGVSPDLDLDGDGLERFMLDSASRIESCIDGDGFTVIAGRECWQDPRMADAFALSASAETVRAVFEGRQPRWREAQTEEGWPACDDPPDASLLDPR